jgi:hypothetical protein
MIYIFLQHTTDKYLVIRLDKFYGKHRLGYQLQLALDQYSDKTIF